MNRQMGLCYMATSIMITLFTGAIFLNGCAIQDPQLNAALSKANDNQGEFIADSASADLSWQRAQVWMAQHSATKISISNEYMIQNEKRSDDEGSRYNLTVTKEPLQAGAAKISLKIEGFCLVCRPKPAEIERLFSHYLRTGEDLMKGIAVLHGIK